MRVDLRLAIVSAVVCGWVSVVPVDAQRPSASAAVPTADDVFDADAVQDLWIKINLKDWATLRETYRENTYYPCDIEWRGVRVRNIGIRSRGRASRNPLKPALRLDFNRYSRGQQFLGLDALALDNLWQDPSMIRERLAMRVFQRMGLPAPRETHVRLYIGPAREFAGVYGAVEAIDKQFLTRHFNEDGGYLYQYQWQDEYHFEDRPALDWYATRFGPATHENASTFDLYAPLRKLVGAINGARESALETELSPYMDLRKFVTYIALENFLSEPDGFLGALGMANFYIYRFDASDRWQLIPWDRDLSFASVEDPGPTRNMELNVLTRKIWAVPELRSLYLKTLVEIAASVGPPQGSTQVVDPFTRQCPAPANQPACGWLEEEVFREYAQVHEAAIEDPLTPYPDDLFEQEITFLERFARERSGVVRRFVTELQPQLLRAR